MLPAPLQVLDTAQGLGSNQIHSVAIDSRDRLWMAMPTGLACYDGGFAHQWDRSNGLLCNGLRCAAVDRDDKVWIGTDRGLELLNSVGVMLPCVDSESWRFGLCSRIDVSGQAPWVSTALGLIRLEPNVDTPGYRAGYFAEVGYVADIVRIGSSRVLATSVEQGLIETDGNRWWRYECAALAGLSTTRLALGQGEQLLVGTNDGMMVVDDRSRDVLAALHTVGSDPAVNAIAVLNDQYWVAYGRTLVAYASGDRTFNLVEALVATSAINDLLPDRLGNVWVATNNSGLAVVSCLRNAIQKINVGHGGGVFSIKAGADSTHHIGGDGLFGVARLTEDAVETKLVAPTGLPDTIVWDSYSDADATWVATDKGLFRAAAGQGFVHAYTQDEILGAPARVMLRRGDALWAGTLRGLTRIGANGPVPCNDAWGVPLGYVYALYLDRAQVLWIATLGRGLWQESNGLRQIVSGPLTKDGNTYAVATGPGDETVVLQDDRVVLLARDLAPRLVVELPPVSGWCVVWLNRYTVAIGASDGLRILDIASGSVVRHIRALYPLRDWEFTNNRSLCLDDSGRLLCGVNGGLIRVNLDKLLPILSAPVCALLDIKWEGDSPQQDGDSFLLRPGRWRVRVRAFAAWLVEPKAISYQFKLIGFDNAWSASTERPEFNYNSSPAGEYTVMVRAHSPLTGYGPETSLLRLKVAHPWWAKGFSSMLDVLDSVYDRLVRSRARNAKLLAENRALELAVAERTAALQATNTDLAVLRDAFQNLSEHDALTQLGNRRKFDSEMPRALSLGQRLNLPVALLLLDVDYFKQVNDRYGHQTGDLYLRTLGRLLASCVRRGEDLATRFGGEEFAIILNNTSEEGANVMAERVRSIIANEAMPNVGAPSGVVTVSVGLAVAWPYADLTADELVQRTDEALYNAKRGGRNCVVIAEGKRRGIVPI